MVRGHKLKHKTHTTVLVEDATQKAGCYKSVLQITGNGQGEPDWQYYLSSYCKHRSSLKHLAMRNLLYIIAVLLLAGWVLGVFVWHASSYVHILIVLAIISFLFGMIRKA